MIPKSFLYPVLLSALATLAACDTAEERAQKHLQSAMELIEGGDFDRAIVEFRNVFELDPNNLEARHTLAKLQDDRGDIRAAMRQYLVIVEQSPEDAIATLRLAELALQTGDWEAAERYGKIAIENSIDAERTEIVSINLDYRQAVLDADAQRRSELANRAIAAYEAAPDTPLMHNVLLDWYLFNNQEREALAQITAAIDDNPENIVLHRTRLMVLESLGETPEIETRIREMVAQFPGDSEVQSLLFRWLVSQGDQDGAEDFLRDLVQSADLEQKNGAQVSLVQFVRSTRGNDEALKELDALIQGDPENNVLKSLSSGIKFDMGDQDTAIAEMQSLIEGPDDSDEKRNFKVVLARMLQSTGNPVGTRALVEEVLAADPTHVEAIKIKVGFLIEGDKASEAIVLLRSAMDVAPEDPDLFSAMAAAYERNGSRDLMGDMLAKAAELSNRGPLESIRLANFFIGREQIRAAEQAIIESLRQNPDNPELLLNLGQIYLQMESLELVQPVIDNLTGLDTEIGNRAADQLKLSLLRAQNRNEDLVAMIESLSEKSNNAARGAIAIARTHLANDDVDAATKVINEGLAENPDDLDLLFAQALVKGILGDAEAARAQLRTILEREPRAVNVWLALARNYIGEGDQTTAEAIVDEALVPNPESGNIRWVKASMLEARGEIGAAIEIYEDLYDAGSSSLIAANNLASLITSYRQSPEVIERAYAIARRLRDLPQPAFQDTYGWIAYLRGELDDALAHMEPAAIGLPNDPLVQYHLARVYEALDRPKDALAAYENAKAVLGDRTNEAMTDLADRLAKMETAAAASDQ